MDPTISENKSKRIYLFSHPRTCSNLFMKMLDKHPSIDPIRYPMQLPLWFGPDRVTERYLTPKVAQYADQLVPLLVDRTLQAVADDLQKRIMTTETEGRCVLIKDHAVRLTRPEVIAGRPDSELVIKVVDRRFDLGNPSASLPERDTYKNPTLYPDRFLSTFVPVFTIRHPVRMIPSYARSSKLAYDETASDSPQAFALATSYKWSRKLFDWYNSDPDCDPIVIDSEDLIRDPEGIIAQFCSRMGIDAHGVQYNWPAETTKHFFEPLPWADPIGFGPASEVFFGTLDSSTGVKRLSNKDPTPPYDPQEEMTGWMQEFGKEDAQRMEEAVRDAMEDYNFLWKNRLRLQSAL